MVDICAINELKRRHFVLLKNYTDVKYLKDQNDNTLQLILKDHTLSPACASIILGATNFLNRIWSYRFSHINVKVIG